MRKKTQPSREDALKKMQKLCSGAEKCKQDIRLNLQRKGMDSRDTDWVIEQLEKEKFIDEERYTGFFVRDKFVLSGWGKIKIAYALRQKHIPEAIVKTQLEEIDPEEYLEKLKSLLKEKNHILREEDEYKRKGKLLAFAAQRGFESELIFSCLDE